MTEVSNIRLDAGHYRIERKDGYGIEVRKERKNKWVNVETGEVKKTRADFEEAVKSYVAPAPAEENKKPKAEKKAKSDNYKGHRNARTAQLHEAFDKLNRHAAMKFAIEELGYTQGGASSWFADWTKLAADSKEPAAEKKTDGRTKAGPRHRKQGAKKATPKATASETVFA